MKVANIAVATMETLRDSSPSAEMIIRDQLAAALAGFAILRRRDGGNNRADFLGYDLAECIDIRLKPFDFSDAGSHVARCDGGRGGSRLMPWVKKPEPPSEDEMAQLLEKYG